MASHVGFYVHGGGLAQGLNANIIGNGTQALVLSHGFGLDQSVWQFIVPYLALYFKVVVFDLAFAGTVRPALYNSNKYSTYGGYAQDLVQLLEELNIRDSIYVGHSMSAMIGCLAASKKPHLFRQLIFLGGSPRYLNDGAYYGGFNRSEVGGILQEIQRNFSAWVPSFATEAIGVNDAKSIRMFEESLGRMRPEVALDVARTVFLSDLRWVLGRVRVPCTIIQSEEDFVVPTSVAYYMKRQLRGESRVEILRARGHIPQLTAYPLLLGVLKRVLGVED